MRRLGELLVEYEHQLIPAGLHVIGETPSLEERVDVLHAFLGAAGGAGDGVAEGQGPRSESPTGRRPRARTSTH